MVEEALFGRWVVAGLSKKQKYNQTQKRFLGVNVE
jgi:hypothetical protein